MYVGVWSCSYAERTTADMKAGKWYRGVLEEVKGFVARLQEHNERPNMQRHAFALDEVDNSSKLKAEKHRTEMPERVPRFQVDC